MIKKPSLIYTLISIGLAFLFTNCEEDFSELNTSIEGATNFETEIKTFPVLAYTKVLNPVQTNDLPSNLIGIYKDSNYGKTTASLVTQVTPASYDPDFGKNPEITSVVINIPYYSTITGEENGINLYKLDSLYGAIGGNNTYKLSIYKNNYLLRDLDPSSGFEQRQAYYSNQLSEIEAQKSDLIYENTTFVPSQKESVGIETDKDDAKKKYSPSLRTTLESDSEKAFWKQLILDNQDKPVLSNADNFKNFFRGLLFKVEDTGSDGNAILLNFSSADANIIINYVNDENKDKEKPLQYKLVFGGQRFNMFENNFTIPNGDKSNGDDILHLKGMQGSAAIVELFKGTIKNENNTDVDALDYFNSKKEDWLINEANLIFHVDNSIIGNQPNRLIIYNLNTNSPVLDYALDIESKSDPSRSRIKHSVPLQKNVDGKEGKYKIRLTDFISELQKKQDTTNLKLGIYITNNINDLPNSKIYGESNDDTDAIINMNVTPKATVLYPLGTKLYGSKQTTPKDKRLELKIYYTKVNN